jgi:chorismate mutase/prephenate dehydratase
MRSTITTIRKKITALDRAIIAKLAARADLARQLGRLKKSSHLPLEDRRRERELAKAHARWAVELAANPRLVKKIFALIIHEAKKIQKNL